MLETVIVLTPIHYVYLLGVIVILAAMIFRLDTPPVCILFLFLLGLLGLGTITGGIQAVFPPSSMQRKNLWRLSPPSRW